MSDTRQSPKIRKLVSDQVKESIINSATAILILSFALGFIGGVLGFFYAPLLLSEDTIQQMLPALERDDISGLNAQTLSVTGQEEVIINAVEGASSSVVSVIATRDLPMVEEYYYSPFGDMFPEFQIPQFRQRGTQERQVSAGTGFVAADDIIITNRHVVEDREADYVIVTQDGERLDAEVITRDPVEDLAILHVSGLNLEPLSLGDSDNLRIGQTAITIGNALGEFDNTVSVGVVSGLHRTLVAGTSGGPGTEVLREVIQTDAAINFGNSGGPLINSSGEVIGVNVAKAASADNIGFAIPINRVKDSLEQVVSTGRVSYPFLGVRYRLVTPQMQEANNLPYDYGALVSRDPNSEGIAVIPGSAADKAGIRENDIILEVNGKQVNSTNTLSSLLSEYSVGETVTLRIYQEGTEKDITAVLGERTQE